MPPTHSPSPTPNPRGVKREASSPTSDEDIKPSTKAKSRTKKPNGGKAPARKWTADELDALLTIALKHGASIPNFEGKIPGRTGLQCMRTWQ
jgi:hypothetical protein